VSSASSKTTTSSEWVGALIERIWKPTVAVTVGVGIIVVFFMFWTPVQAGIDDRSTQRAERAQSIYSDWQQESDAVARATLAQQLQTEISQVLEEFPNRYAGSRARYIRAEFSFANGEWQSAADDWLLVEEAQKGSYLGALALFNAATAAEEAGDLDVARQRLERMVADYDDSPLSPRGLFGLGRVGERSNDFAAASAAYEQLEQGFSGSDWATLARNRLIALGIDGRLEG
jgi:tetratricopeptide (TPR) repeat protein